MDTSRNNSPDNSILETTSEPGGSGQANGTKKVKIEDTTSSNPHSPKTDSVVNEVGKKDSGEQIQAKEKGDSESKPECSHDNENKGNDAGPSTSSSGEADDESSDEELSEETMAEKRVLVQRQLKMLLHVKRCLKQEEEIRREGQTPPACPVYHCRTIRDVLEHMKTCNDGKYLLIF